MTYEKVFRCTVRAGEEMFNVKLVVQAMVSDKSSPARNAARAVFGPGVKLILCWPHISRGVRLVPLQLPALTGDPRHSGKSIYAVNMQCHVVKCKQRRLD